ncbi:Fatty-acid amide hydrolase 2 like protein [Argiope bruennichi]|uniref:Fatty-acid amide hydrolase 2 like protein n=1 Tax=Argiope bruennichi TaxID=94029 RepID=A0A8T0EE66_ARGBR|nr:Fatty-acid amide hydrolase 2 like protein [Argiope bruennichi]
MGDILYRILQTLLSVFCFVQSSILILIYGGKGKVVPPIKNPLLLKSASKLAEEIREGKIRSEDVVLAYIHRISEVQPYLNATVDCFFDDAIQQAREVDILVASRRCTVEELANKKPLLGVPFTAKVLLHLKGMPCTGASKIFEDQVATEDSPSVALMKDAGAILIATTNSAELALNIETVNKIYGRTCNPYDTNRTPGGSSGGESALIAAGGSLIGLGNDLAGSVRIPAHFTGIFGHKPTAGLVTNRGSFPPEFPNKLLEPVHMNIFKYLCTGPLCRYAEDLTLVMKILSTEDELKVDFNQKVDFKKLKICYLTNIRSPLVSTTDKRIIAALKNAVTFFEKKCNTVAKEIKIPSWVRVNRCICSVFMRLLNNYEKEICIMKGLNENFEFLKSFFGVAKIVFVSAFMIWLSPLLYSEDKFEFYAEMIRGLREEFNNNLDKNTILLMPTYPCIVPYHNGTFPYLLSLSFTTLFNLLGLPATHCPMDFTEQKLPYGIQIVGCKGNDALTIACAAELEKEFGGWKPPGEG